MGIVYPIDLPNPPKIRKIFFDLDYLNTDGMTRGGDHQTINLGPELWKVSIETSLLSEVNFANYRAFISKLRGGLGTVKIWDKSREYPVLYPTGFSGMIKAIGGAFTGECVLLSVSNLDAHEVELSELPIGYTFSYSDYIGFDYIAGGKSRRVLHRVVEPSIASNLGKATLLVEPAVIPGWVSGTLVQLSKNWIVVTIRAKDIDAGTSEVGTLPVMAFSGIQSLNY